MSKTAWLSWSISIFMLFVTFVFSFMLSSKQNVNPEIIETAYFDSLAEKLTSKLASLNHPFKTIALVRSEADSSKTIETNLSLELNRHGINTISHNFIKDITDDNLDINSILNEIPSDVLLKIDGDESMHAYDRIQLTGKITIFSNSKKTIICEKEIDFRVLKSLLNEKYFFFSLNKIEIEIRFILLTLVLGCMPFILSPISYLVLRKNIESQKMVILTLHIITGFMFILFYLSFKINVVNSIFSAALISVYGYFCYKYLLTLEHSIE
ncbi:MAG: hypothetical protein HY606_08390 [Planctomycetes bacterium]|nr:hypothetical protein [Planctomycetota bacterium]